MGTEDSIYLSLHTILVYLNLQGRVLSGFTRTQYNTGDAEEHSVGLNLGATLAADDLRKRVGVRKPHTEPDSLFHLKRNTLREYVTGGPSLMHIWTMHMPSIAPS